jgi:hypothetical protein
MHTRFWLGNAMERNHLEVPSVDGRTILKWIFRKFDRGHGPNLSGSELGQVAGTCECGNETWVP